MKISASKYAQWTDYAIPGGGVLKVRARGVDMAKRADELIAEARARRGITDEKIPLPTDEFNDIMLLCHMGTTYGGFSGIIDEETGEPIPDKDQDGNLREDAFRAVVGVDEIFVGFAAEVNRLSVIRDERMSGARKNSPTTTGGASDTVVVN